MSNISQYINSLHGKSPGVLHEIEQNNVTGDIIYPILGADAGRFLYTYVLANRPATILELGTGCGYATIWLAMAAETYGAEIISIDINEEILKIAKENLQKAKLIDYVSLVHANAKEWVNNCKHQFDLILQDTYPKLYGEMLNDCLNILGKRKTLVTHDAIVTALNCHEQLAQEMNQVNELISSHPNLSSTIIPINDGLWLSVKSI